MSVKLTSVAYKVDCPVCKSPKGQQCMNQTNRGGRLGRLAYGAHSPRLALGRAL